MVQLVGGVTAVQLKPMTLEEDAVAVRPVGAAGTAPHGMGEVATKACAEATDEP